MKRFFLATFLTIVALLAMAAAAAGIFLSTLDLDSYKETIAQELSVALGRPVSVEGSIHHSLMPLGLTLDRLVILDALVYGPEPFLVVEGVSLSTAPWQLLTGSLSIDSISVQRAELKLAIAATGSANWQTGTASQPMEIASDTPLQDSSQPVASTPITPEATPASQPFWGKDIPLHFAIGTFSLQASTVTFKDLRQNATYLATLDTLTLSGVGLDRDVPFALGGTVSQLQDRRKGTLVANGIVRLGSAGDIALTLHRADAVFTSPAAPNSTLTLAVEVAARFAHSARLLTLDHLVATVNGTTIAGNLALALAVGQPGIDRDIQGSLAFGDVNIDALTLAAESLRPVRYKERTGVSDTEILAITRRTPSTGAPAPVVTPGRNPTLQGQEPLRETRQEPTPPTDTPTHDEVLSSPLAPLRTVSAKVAYTAKSIRSGSITLHNIKGTLLSDGNTLTLPIALEAFSGQFSGTLTCDIPSPKPGLHLVAEARGVNAAQAIQALGGSKKSPITGTMSASCDAFARGLDAWPVLAKTLQGKAALGLQNSQVIDALPHDLARAIGLPADIPISKGTASFTIANGVGTTNDLSVTSPLGSASGQGTVNLVRERMDLAIGLLVGGRQPLVPLLVNGGFSSPAVSLDSARATKGLLQELGRAGNLGIPAPKAKDIGRTLDGLLRQF